MIADEGGGSLPSKTTLEENIRQLEEHRQLVADAARAYSYERNLATGEFRYSDPVEEITGFPVRTAADRDIFLRHIHPDDLERYQQAIDHALNPHGAGVFDVEFRFIRDDGDTRWFAAKGKVHFEGEDSDRKPVRVTGLIIDSTERKEAEFALLRREERRRLAVEYANSFTFERDLTTGELEFDEAAYALYGFPPGSKLNADDLYAHVPAEDAARMHSLVREALASDQPHKWEVEFKFHRSDGQTRWFNSRSTTFFNSTVKEGGPAKILGLVTDITERKRAEQAQKLLAEASRVLSSSLDINETLDRVVNIALPSFADMCGVDLLDADGVLKRAAVAHVHPEAREAAWRAAGQGAPLPENHVIKQVLTTAKPILIPDVTDDVLDRLTRNQQQRRFVDELAPRSLMLAPLINGGVTLGTLQFGTMQGGRQFDAHDLEVAEELGRRCGLAVGTARLHSELKASEERFRVLADAMPQLVWTAEPDGTVDYYNSRVKQFEGFEFNPQTKKWRWNPVLHPDDEALTARAWADAVESGQEYLEEHRVRVKENGDNHYRWFLSRATPVRDSAGKVIKWYGTATDIDASKRVEEALRESEERYRSSFENSAVGITHVGLDRKIIAVNPKFCEMVGYNRGELIGTDIFDITARGFKTYHPLTERLYKGEIQHLETEKQYLHKDGHLISARATITIQRDSEGNPLYRISIIEDISDRKRAEMRLAAEHAISMVLTAVTTMDEAAPQLLQALCEHLNVDIAEMWLPRDDHKKIHCAESWASDSIKEYAEQWRQLTDSVRFRVGEGLPGMVWRSRSPQWLTDIGAGPPSPRKQLALDMGIASNMAFPLMAGEQRIGVICLFAKRPLVVDELLEESLASLGRDISQFMLREQVEKSLRQSEERYRGTFENAAVGVAHISLDGHYMRANKKLCEITGYDTEELLSITFQQITHPNDLKADLEGMRKLLGGEITEYTVEKRITRKGGDPIWISVTRSLAYRPDGSPDYLIAVAIDISLRKELEATLRQTNETLEQRVAERTVELEELTESLRMLAARLSQAEQSERRRLAELIHDDLQQLLVAARIQVRSVQSAGDQAVAARASQHVVSLLDQAIEAARSLTTQLRPPALYESGLAASLGWLAAWIEQAYEFHVDLDLNVLADNLPEQDAVLLFDAVREMLLNAVKHSGADRASVGLSETGDKWLLISVSDRGSGFDVSELAGPRTDSGGFGLFGIRERVAAMGGRFEVKSAPGEGAKFSIFWPATSATGPDAGESFRLENEGRLFEPSDDRGKTAGEVTVLLVDDHALVRQSLADVMSREPDLVVTAEASDGEQAVEAAEKYRPQIVVMDVNLPKLNGVQATRIIKQRHPDINVIGVSIHSDPATRQAMLNAGASAYISKDGPVETLLDTIRNQGRATDASRA